MDIQNSLLEPLRPLVSKSALTAYLGTFLFLATATCMIFVSALAYGVFYYKFIPQVGLERVVHLQFGLVFSYSNETNKHCTTNIRSRIETGILGEPQRSIQA